MMFDMMVVVMFELLMILMLLLFEEVEVVCELWLLLLCGDMYFSVVGMVLEVRKLVV